MRSVLDGFAELAMRERDGITVRLLWDAATNDVWLSYTDSREHIHFAAQVDAPDALEAFRHPNLFRPRKGPRQDAQPAHGGGAASLESASPGAMGDLGAHLRDRP